MPFASVIIPSYNRVELTIRAIHSVLSQSYTDFELIVVNDGSSDNYEKIKSIISKYNHIYIEQSHGGVSKARNTGLLSASGEYIFLLDSDDEWMIDKLDNQVRFFEMHPDAVLSQTKEQWVRNGSNVQTPLHLEPGDGDCFIRSLHMCCVSSSSVGFKRTLIHEIGLFNEKLRICEDYDYWLRAVLRYPIFCIDRALVVKYSGTHPQLSNSEVAMDRYRVYALLSLLEYVHRCAFALTVDRRASIYEVLRKKTHILKNGAQKRGYENEVYVYHDIISLLDRAHDANELSHILQGMEAVLEYRPKFDIQR